MTDRPRHRRGRRAVTNQRRSELDDRSAGCDVTSARRRIARIVYFRSSVPRPTAIPVDCPNPPSSCGVPGWTGTSGNLVRGFRLSPTNPLARSLVAPVARSLTGSHRPVGVGRSGLFNTDVDRPSTSGVTVALNTVYRYNSTVRYVRTYARSYYG